MAVVIGCSGSTGSSLLKTILNRHSQIFAGPEAALFAFPQVYNNWNLYKKQLLKSLKTDTWQLRKGMNLLQPAFGWEVTALQRMAAHASSFPMFVQTFFSKPLQQENKQIWIAKAPANVIGMAPFLNHFPTGKIVQTIRNPYDTIASLMARGMNAYAATAYYVYNTAVATSNRGKARYYEIKYEDLVSATEPTVKDLLAFLDCPFEPQILIAQHEKRAEPIAMKGWKQQETATIKASSIGRFQELNDEKKMLVRSAFSAFRISERYQKKQQIKFKSGEELCAVLGYEYLPGAPKKYQWLLKKYYWRDRLGRVKHGFSWQFLAYPGELEMGK